MTVSRRGIGGPNTENTSAGVYSAQLVIDLTVFLGVSVENYANY